mgnify:CR=1 FL=1
MKAHARKRQSGNVLDIVPEGTPTEVVEHRLSEEERICDTCGSVMEEIGKEVRRSLKMEPAGSGFRKMCTTPTLQAVRGGNGGRKSPKDTQKAHILPWQFCLSGSSGPHYDPEIVMYLPLYRLEQEFQRQGLKLSRQTMPTGSSGLGHLAAACVRRTAPEAVPRKCTARG